MARRSVCSTAMSNGKAMQESEAINLIQKTLTGIKLIADSGMSEPEDWLMDELNKIQWIINEYRNQEFKLTEPDPFS